MITSLDCISAESIKRQLCNGPKLGVSSTLTEAFRCGAEVHALIIIVFIIPSQPTSNKDKSLSCSNGH